MNVMEWQDLEVRKVGSQTKHRKSSPTKLFLRFLHRQLGLVDLPDSVAPVDPSAFSAGLCQDFDCQGCPIALPQCDTGVTQVLERDQQFVLLELPREPVKLRPCPHVEFL